MSRDSDTRSSPQQGGSDINLGGTLPRLASLETHLPYLATTKDIADLKSMISESERRSAERETTQLRWLLGIIVAAGMSLVITLIAAVVQLVAN